MRYSAGQAAKAVGVSTSTITRALKSGKISGEKQAEGGWFIDPSELHRVFPAVTPPQSQDSPTLQHETPKFDSRNSGLERLVETLQEQLRDVRDDRESWRQEADNWRQQAERLALMLPAMPSPPAPAATPEASISGQGKRVGGLWSWLKGKTPSTD